jgi:hypothetical protein
VDIEFNLMAIERQRQVDIGGIRLAMEAQRSRAREREAAERRGRALSALASFDDTVWARPEAPPRRPRPA